MTLWVITIGLVLVSGVCVHHIAYRKGFSDGVRWYNDPSYPDKPGDGWWEWESINAVRETIETYRNPVHRSKNEFH